MSLRCLIQKQKVPEETRGFVSCVENKRQQSFPKPGRVLLKLPFNVKDQNVRKSNQTNQILTLWDRRSGRPPVPKMRREFFSKLVWEHVGCWVRRCYIGLRSALRAGQSSRGKSFLYGGKAGRWPELQSFLWAGFCSLVCFNNRSEFRWDDLLR